MKTRNLIKPAVFTLLALSATSAYADMSQDYNASKASAVVTPAVSDDSLTKDIMTKIAAQVPAMNIEVNTHEGVVTLSGMVDTQAKADTAMSIAKTANGVKDVKSSIQVK